MQPTDGYTGRRMYGGLDHATMHIYCHFFRDAACQAVGTLSQQETGFERLQTQIWPVQLALLTIRWIHTDRLDNLGSVKKQVPELNLVSEPKLVAIRLAKLWDRGHE
jgi:hypothetical protein